MLGWNVGRRQWWRRSLRNAGIAALSFTLVLGAVAYLVTPQATAFAISVSPSGAFHGRDGVAVVYGKARDLQGDGIAGLRLVVTSVRHPVKTLAELGTASDGTFRGEIPVRVGLYKISIRESAHRRLESTAQVMALGPGRTFRVSIVAKRHGGFWFIPVGGY